jgi:hypothetical protein
MNSIWNMPKHEASMRASLERDAVHGFIEPLVQGVKTDAFAFREVPKQRRVNSLASGLRHMQEHETLLIGTSLGT